MSCQRAAPYAVLLVCVLCTFQWAQCFNLEPRIPIVKKGPAKSHFGYTVAQHKSTNKGKPGFDQYTSWMLVGAPKGENLQPGTNKSGALYKCPLTTYTNDCEQVQTDGLKSPDGRILPPTDDEIKDDQWMGVTVKSQGEGGDILVCGHRYQHKGIGEQNFQWGYGLCYRLNDGFEYVDNYQPCMGKPVSLEHEQFGYCQAGTSGMILEDEVVLGIPGTYTWRGTVHTRNISDDYLYRDKTQYFGVYTDDDSPVDKYSYLGYSVTAGKFFGDKMSYVAGAPRSRGNGQVIFFSRSKMGNPLMKFDLVLNGEVFASSFGFEVLAMDTNGDNRDDLVVSAPFYFTKQSSGAVYIYKSDLNKGISNLTPFTRLEGPPGESRFGYSMTSLGDLNLDGYNDLAVGAPYDNKGAIYIYLGSKDGIIKEPAQVIRAEDLPGLPYDAFGYSLSGGIDLDGNKYNDLLTSSFCSDRVILLRARPIVSIQTEVETQHMQNIDPTKRGCVADRNSPDTCFSFKTCFKMMNEAGTLTSLQVRYNISERVYKDQPVHRIRFHRAKPENPSTIEQIINLRPDNMGKKQCFNEIVYLYEGIRDVLRPVRFKLAYEIHQEDPRPVPEGESLPDINDYPILNQKEAVRHFEATFAKDCGDDDICESDLTVVGELDLEKYSDDISYIYELGKQQYFTLTTSVTNNGEPAYVPNLYVAHDKAIDLSLRETETGSYHCVTVTNGLINCNLDNPLINTTGPLRLVFKPSGLPFTSGKIDLLVWANSTSEELNHEDNRVKFVLDVKRRAEISIVGSAAPEQVFYSGEIVGESAIKKLEEIGTQVIHKYIIDNRGPWKVEEMQVRIDWPYQVENNKKEGKWLLYLTDIPIVHGDGECDVNPKYVNPLSLEAEKVSVEAEVDIGSHDKLTGFTTPKTVSSTSKTVKTKKVITTKKTYTSKTSTSQKSSSSSSAASSSSSQEAAALEEEEEEGNVEGLSGREQGTRTHTRMSRKTYHSSANGNRGKKHPHKEGAYDDNTDDYENYDNFFYGNKEDHDGSGSHKQSAGKTNTAESSHTRRVYTSSSNFATDTDRLNAVDDIQTVTDGDETYLKGYDRSGNLVWTSRSSTQTGKDSAGQPDGSSGLETDGGNVRTRTEYSRRVYSSSVGERDNEKQLNERLGSIVDFRIVKEGDESFVDGYDQDGRVIWTSRRSSWRTKSPQVDLDEKAGGRGSGTSFKKEYSYRESTRDGEGERSWKSSVTDDKGTKTSSGSAKIYGGGREGTDPPFDRRDYERRDRISSEGGSKDYFGPDDYSESEGTRSRSFSNRTSSGGEVHVSRSSSNVGGSGSSSSYSGDRRKIHESSQPYDEVDQNGNRRYHFDWSDPSDRHGQGSHSSRTMHHQSSSDDDVPEGRWSKSGGFRRKESYSSSGVSSSNYDDSVTPDDELYQGSSRDFKSRNYNRHSEVDPDRDFRANTYSRVVMNDDSGDANVYTQKVFSRRSGDQWQEIKHGPYRDEEWEKSETQERTLKRTKREREFIIKPEAITDAQTGKMMQIVSFRCDGDVPTAKCFTFTCTIRNLDKDQSVSIEIPSRLWNSTLVEDYPRVSYVSIKSRGELVLPDEIRLDQDQSDDQSFAETLAYSNLLEQLPPESVPIWVIVVSVLAGLLLLVLIAIVLYKLGFFKRKRPDPTLSGNLDRDINGYN